jgi:hypothetical protein
MFTHKHYVPILKGRKGEYGALETLSPAVKTALTPLIEIPPIPWDWQEEQPAKSIDTHLEKVGANLQRCWPSDRPLYVDLLWISESERMSDGEHPLEYVFRAARERSLWTIPVVNLIRGDEYLEACSTVLQQDEHGVCVRIQREDFTDFPQLESQMLGMLERLSVSTRDADLILDIRSITPPRQADVNAIISMAQALPRIREWRSFTITATSFPENLTGLPPSVSSLIDRMEWRLWLDLWRRRRELPRRPTFGDYAISHPEPAEVDPRVMRPSASIRYTTEEAWLVLKGRNLRDNGFSQFHEVCSELIRCPEFSGADFSWGDGYIYDCAYQRAGPGNLTTWRKVGTSHHLGFAVRQLANLYGS